MKLRTAPGSAVPFHVAATALDPSPANAIAKKTTDICLIALPLFLTAHRSYTGKAVSTMNGLLTMPYPPLQAPPMTLGNMRSRGRSSYGLAA